MHKLNHVKVTHVFNGDTRPKIGFINIRSLGSKAFFFMI